MTGERQVGDAAYPRGIQHTARGGLPVLRVSGNADQGMPVKFYRWRGRDIRPARPVGISGEVAVEGAWANSR